MIGLMNYLINLGSQNLESNALFMGENMHYLQRGIAFFFSLLLLSGCQLYSGAPLFQPPSTDALITSSVKEAFAQDASLASLPLHVETADKVVYLSGYVKTIRQSDTAQWVASKVTGVKSVENDIIVRK